MKKHTVMLVILIISSMLSTPVYSSDQNYYKNILRKISPIHSIILLCDGQGKDACAEDSLWAMLSQTHIQIVSRHTLNTILSELKLQASGLTAAQTAKIGKLSGASHVLLYSREESTPLCYIVYNFQLVNVSTSIIEYATNTCVLSDKGSQSAAADSFTSPMLFFAILNKKALYPSVDAIIYDQIKAEEGETEAEKYMDLSEAAKKEYMRQKGWTIQQKQENK